MHAGSETFRLSAPAVAVFSAQTIGAPGQRAVPAHTSTVNETMPRSSDLLGIGSVELTNGSYIS
jgi:hypothetical protein